MDEHMLDDNIALLEFIIHLILITKNFQVVTLKVSSL